MLLIIINTSYCYLSKGSKHFFSTAVEFTVTVGFIFGPCSNFCGNLMFYKNIDTINIVQCLRDVALDQIGTVTDQHSHPEASKRKIQRYCNCNSMFDRVHWLHYRRACVVFKSEHWVTCTCSERGGTETIKSNPPALTWSLTSFLWLNITRAIKRLWNISDHFFSCKARIYVAPIQSNVKEWWKKASEVLKGIS